MSKSWDSFNRYINLGINDIQYIVCTEILSKSFSSLSRVTEVPNQNPSRWPTRRITLHQDRLSLLEKPPMSWYNGASRWDHTRLQLRIWSSKGDICRAVRICLSVSSSCSVVLKLQFVNMIQYSQTSANHTTFILVTFFKEISLQAVVMVGKRKCPVKSTDTFWWVHWHAVVENSLRTGYLKGKNSDLSKQRLDIAWYHMPTGGDSLR